MFVLSADGQIYFQLGWENGLNTLRLYKKNDQGQFLCILHSPVGNFILDKHYSSSKKIIKIGYILFSITNSEIEYFKSVLRKAQLKFFNDCLSLSKVD